MQRCRVIMALLPLVVAGCSTPVKPGADASAGPRFGIHDEGRSMFGLGENGLQVRRWRVIDRPGEIAGALMRHATAPVLDEPVRARLERNGFRLVRIPVGDVELLLNDLGSVSFDVNGWHGQAYDWREVASVPVSAAGQAVAVSGHPQRLAGGTLRLMIRGWTVQMEDGPFLYLEMVPEYDRTRPTPLEKMLGRRTFDGERFDDMMIALFLEPAYAYVLTYETPGVGWASSGDTAPASRVGSIGPGTVMPRTLGELLLTNTIGPPSREIFVLIPRIPAALYPPAEVTS